MNKQDSKRIVKPKVSKNVSKDTWKKLSAVFGFVAAVMTLLGIFAVVSFADNETHALTGGDEMTLTCDGRGFNIQRESRQNVKLTCVASNNNSPVPTAIPPVEEPPAEPTAQPPVAGNPISEGSIFVATNGNDNNTGSEQQPLRTIQKAIDMAKPGDTILVRGGTYAEVVTFTQSGKDGQPITLAAYPGEKPVIDGQYNLPAVPNSGWATCNNTVSPATCFHYKPLVDIAASYIVLDGFEVRHSLGRGVWIHNKDFRVNNIVVRNMEIHDNRNAGIKMMDADYVVFEASRVWHNSNYATHDRPAKELNWSHAVNALQSTNITYRNNVIFNNYGEGIGTGRGSSNITIINNEVYDNLALQVYIHRSVDVEVSNNKVYCTGDKNFLRGGNIPSGIVVNNESSFTNLSVVDNALVRDNYIVGCRQGFAMWGGGGSVKIGSRNITVENNTFVNAASMPNKNEASAITILEGEGHHNINIRNNVIYQEEFNMAYIVPDPAISFASNMWSQMPPENAKSSTDNYGNFSLVNPDAPLVPGQLNVDNYKLVNGSADGS